MKILAVEFSSEQRSVAVLQEGRALGCASETGGRTARAFTLIEKALREARLEREDIECIAVGLGPGSYAGTRAAIALAQGWQVARPIRLLGISSVECLAAQARASGMSGRVNVLIDAQRNEFYFAAYEIDERGSHMAEPLQIVTRAAVEARCALGETVVGPDLLGQFPKARLLLPDAATLGGIASTQTGFVSGDKLEPIYLRQATFVKSPPPRIISNL